MSRLRAAAATLAKPASNWSHLHSKLICLAVGLSALAAQALEPLPYYTTGGSIASVGISLPGFTSVRPGSTLAPQLTPSGATLTSIRPIPSSIKTSLTRPAFSPPTYAKRDYAHGSLFPSPAPSQAKLGSLFHVGAATSANQLQAATARQPSPLPLTPVVSTAIPIYSTPLLDAGATAQLLRGGPALSAAPPAMPRHLLLTAPVRTSPGTPWPAQSGAIPTALPR
jgi:hypothetical protein